MLHGILRTIWPSTKHSICLVLESAMAMRDLPMEKFAEALAPP